MFVKHKVNIQVNIKGFGWIKIHRKFLDWQWFEKPEAVQLFVLYVVKGKP
jgi:hypothetical protein